MAKMKFFGFVCILVFSYLASARSISDQWQVSANIGIAVPNDIKQTQYDLAEKVGITSIHPTQYYRLSDIDVFFKNGSMTSLEFSKLSRGYRYGFEGYLSSVSLDEISVGGEKWGLGPLESTTRTISLMTNGYLDFFDGWFQPYVGFGLGPAWVHSEIKFDGNKKSSSNFNVLSQVLGGAKVWLDKKINLTLGARYVVNAFNNEHLGGRQNNVIFHTGLTYIL